MGTVRNRHAEPRMRSKTVFSEALRYYTGANHNRKISRNFYGSSTIKVDERCNYYGSWTIKLDERNYYGSVLQWNRTEGDTQSRLRIQPTKCDRRVLALARLLLTLL
jgi:hypothetical protein